MPSTSSGIIALPVVALLAVSGPGDALDLARAERLGLARQLALHRVAHERGDDVRDPGNEAEHEPDDRAAADRRRRILQILEPRDQAAQRRLDDLDLGDLLEVDQDLADAEQAERDGDEADALGELDLSRT